MGSKLWLCLLFFALCKRANSNVNEEKEIKTSKEQNWTGSNQTFQIQLDAKGAVQLYWKIHYEEEYLLFEIRAKLSPAAIRPFFALGFSDYGNRTDADFCIFWIDKRHRYHFQDTWTDSNGFVNLDSKNDCEILGAKVNGNSLILLFKRRMQTCDPHDHRIEDGTNHILWAKGNLSADNVYGMNMMRVAQFGFQRITLLKNLNPMPKLFPDDVKTIKIITDQILVPSVETTYWCKVHRLPEEFQKKRHLVRYDPIIDKGNEGLVHHMELFHCEVNSNLQIPLYSGPCTAATAPDVLKKCKKVIAAWAMGAPPLSYPKEAGLSIGGANFSLFVMQEIHFNNPELLSGHVDSSGFRLYHTEKLRQFDMGIMELGLEYSAKNSIPPAQPHFQLNGICVSECTRAALPEGGIIVVASQMHTHLTGISMLTRHVRGDKELQPLNQDLHYSTHFQEIRLLKRPVQVLPGDQLITSCTYKSMDRSEAVLGGYGIRDEMCVNYIHYYPASSLEVCKSSVDTEHLWNYFRDIKQRHLQPLQVPERADLLTESIVEHNYRAIHWTPYLSDNLHQMYSDSPLSVQCNRSSGDRFPGNWNGIFPNFNFKPFSDSTENECNKESV